MKLIHERTYGIDYPIGEPKYLNKGLGKQTVALLAYYIFSLPSAQRVTADIYKENTTSESVLLANELILFDKENSRYVKEKVDN